MATNEVYILLKSIDVYLKGQLFNTFGGAITGISIKINGKSKQIEFTNKEFFKLLEE